MGKAGVFDAGSEENLAAKEALARDTTGEKVGGFIGDVASFALGLLQLLSNSTIKWDS